MEFFNRFTSTYIFYVQELWLPLLIGFLLSGMLNEIIPSSLVEKFLGKRGIKSILTASFIGVVLPVCCFGSLPIAVTLRKKGASLGPVLAFLVATPATSVSALIVCWRLLGFNFTLYIFAAVIIMGLVMGIIGNGLKADARDNHSREDCCQEHSQEKPADSSKIQNRIVSIFKYALITLPKEIGVELLLGVALASFLTVFQPAQDVISQYLTGVWSYVAVLLFGLSTYVCSTASVPLADALIKSGIGVGPAMAYLLVGPITSYGTILVIKKEFGLRVLGAYLTLISVLSVVFGVVFSFLSAH